MAALYRIRNWDSIFENNRTKELKSMAWVPIPTKLASDGYTELMDHPNGPAHYGAWITCVHVASRCDPRGTLVRGDGRPHDALSLSRITRVPASTYEELLPRLLVVGWLEVVTTGQVIGCINAAGIPQEPATSPQVACARVEQNGMEQNGMEQQRTTGSGSRRGVFVKPSLEEVSAYCRDRGNTVEADQFVEFYASKGWRVGNQAMKDWQAAVRTWEKRSAANKSNGSPPSDPYAGWPEEYFLEDDDPKRIEWVKNGKQGMPA